MYAIARSVSCGERVEHVERGDVDDHTFRSIASDQLGEVIAELDQILIGERRLNARDQEPTLFQNGNGHAALTVVVPVSKRLGGPGEAADE
jgi:hypothetical protein